MLLMHLLRAHAHNKTSVRHTNYRLVFLEEGPLVAEVKTLGYEAMAILPGRLRNVPGILSTVMRLRREFERTRADIVLSWMPKAHFYSAPAAALAGVTSAWWQHGVTQGHWMDRSVTLLPARRVLCCSNAVADAQKSLFPKRSTRVIYPAVELDRFDPARLPSPSDARRELGLPVDGFVIGAVARLQSQKGLNVFIDAAAAISKNRPAPYFVIVGGVHAPEPAHQSELKKQVEQLGLTDRLRLAGHQENVALWMQAMDMVVLPSVEPEGFGMVLIEAMALGKLVIATALGGALEIIEDRKDGILVPPRDSATLATAIVQLFADKRLRDSLRLAARRKAECFSADSLATALERELFAMHPVPK